MADAPFTLAQYKAQMVSIPSRDFRMGRTPVTVGMWQEFCQATGKRCQNFPMIASGSEVGLWFRIIPLYADQFKVMLSDLDREIDLGFRLCSAH